MKNLSNKVALVVGASGGIGSAIVKRLHDEGATVILSARRESLLQETAKRLGLTRYEIAPANAAESHQAYRLFRSFRVRDDGKTESTRRGIDIVVIAAGKWESLGVNTDVNYAESVMKEAITAHLMPTFNVAYRAAQTMPRGGIIINISSHAAFRADLKNNLAYGAAKAAARHFMHLLANEIKDEGIRVYDIQPSTVNTEDMRQNVIPPGKEDLAVQPEEIAERVVHLATHDVKEIDQPMIGKLPDF